MSELIKMFIGNPMEYETWIDTIEDIYESNYESNDGIHVSAINEFHKKVIKNKYMKVLKRCLLQLK